MTLLSNSMIHSQADNDDNESDDNDINIPIDIFIFEDDYDDFVVDDEVIDVDSLIAEYIAIMDIPAEERTVEQWRRTNEILFLIYFNYDISDLLTELQALEEERRRTVQEINTIYNQLLEVGSYLDASIGITIDYVNDLQTNFNELYSTHETLMNDYETLLANYNDLINSLSLRKTIYFNLGVGYIFPKNFIAELGFTLPIGDNMFLGASGLFYTNFQTSHGGIKLEFGFGL